MECRACRRRGQWKGQGPMSHREVQPDRRCVHDRPFDRFTPARRLDLEDGEERRPEGHEEQEDQEFEFDAHGVACLVIG